MKRLTIPGSGTESRATKPARVSAPATLGGAAFGASREDNADQPQMWAIDHHPGRVFVSIPGHYMWTFDDPLFRTLIVRGIAWVGNRPVDRFNELIPLDARIE